MRRYRSHLLTLRSAVRREGEEVSFGRREGREGKKEGGRTTELERIRREEGREERWRRP